MENNKTPYYIYGINGPVIYVRGGRELPRMSLVYVGEQRLFGEVVSSWQRTEAGIVLFVRLPEGAHGTLRLHGGWTCGGDLRLTPGGNRFVLTRTNA